MCALSDKVGAFAAIGERSNSISPMSAPVARSISCKDVLVTETTLPRVYRSFCFQHDEETLNTLSIACFGELIEPAYRVEKHMLWLVSSIALDRCTNCALLDTERHINVNPHSSWFFLRPSNWDLFAHRSRLFVLLINVDRKSLSKRIKETNNALLR